MKKLLYLIILGLIVFLVMAKAGHDTGGITSRSSQKKPSITAVSDKVKEENSNTTKKLSAIKNIFSSESEDKDEDTSFISEVLNKFKKIKTFFEGEVSEEVEDIQNISLVDVSETKKESGNQEKESVKVLDSTGVTSVVEEEFYNVSEYSSYETFLQSIKRNSETIILEEDVSKQGEDVKIIITKYFDPDTESDVYKLYILKISGDKVSVFSDFTI